MQNIVAMRQKFSCRLLVPVLVKPTSMTENGRSGIPDRYGCPITKGNLALGLAGQLGCIPLGNA